MAIKLVILEGKQKGREIPLPETIFLIGRDEQCHIRPHCEAVSQLHCAIAAWAGKVRVRDLQSRNGTFLNGQRISGEVVVDDGDKLQIGSLLFAFRFENVKGTPKAEPIRDEKEVQWLLESPADSPVLAPGFGTWLVPPAAPSEPKKAVPQPTGGSATMRGNKSISAGEHLRTYIEQRRRNPPSSSSKKV